MSGETTSMTGLENRQRRRARPIPEAAGFDPDVAWTLASDVDGTLTGNRAALDRLVARLQPRRSAGQLYLILSTGRRLDEVVDGIASEGLPVPDAVVCQVGTEIYLGPSLIGAEPLAVWRDRLLGEYSREEALGFLEGIKGLVMQPDRYQTELKTSCFLDRCPDPEAAARQIAQRIQPHADRYQVVWSSGRDLDVLPAAAGKGNAIRFLVEYWSLDPQRVIVAGDTGNDGSMFEAFANGIVVANAQPELFELVRSLPAHRIYEARHSFAAGIEEGLEHFGELDGGDGSEQSGAPAYCR